MPECWSIDLAMGPGVEKAFEVAIEFAQEPMHVNNIAGVDSRSGVDFLALSERRQRHRRLVSKLDVIAGRTAQFAQRAAGFGGVTIIQDSCNEIAIVAIVACHGNHPETTFPANHFQVVGEKPTMANAAAIDSLEDILFDLKFGCF